MIRENWKIILVFLWMLIIIPLFVYHKINSDKDLSDYEKWKSIQTSFEKEFKEIILPPKTAVNKFENMSKPRESILLTTRYRTELNEIEFINHLKNELSKKGWIYYGKSENDVDKYFCREKFDAVLHSEGKGGIFGDGANYFQLEFVLGLGVRNRSQNLPKSCS